MCRLGAKVRRAGVAGRLGERLRCGQGLAGCDAPPGRIGSWHERRRRVVRRWWSRTSRRLSKSSYEAERWPTNYVAGEQTATATSVFVQMSTSPFPWYQKAQPNRGLGASSTPQFPWATSLCRRCPTPVHVCGQSARLVWIGAHPTPTVLQHLSVNLLEAAFRVRVSAVVPSCFALFAMS